MPKILDKADLPKDIFSRDASPAMLAQAVRVYLANHQQGTQNAKTRAEIARTRKKLYKQKGTGGARHGDRKAPIFVGGGIAFAPKPRDHTLKMPGKMNRQAIFGALSLKAKEKNVFVVSSLADLTGKTKEARNLLNTLALDAKKNFQKILIVTDLGHENIYRASRNLKGVTVIPANLVNVYEVLKTDKILVMEEAIGLLNKPTQIKDKGSEIKEREQEVKKMEGKKTKTLRVKKPKTKISASKKPTRKVANKK